MFQGLMRISPDFLDEDCSFKLKLFKISQWYKNCLEFRTLSLHVFLLCQYCTQRGYHLCNFVIVVQQVLSSGTCWVATFWGSFSVVCFQLIIFVVVCIPKFVVNFYCCYNLLFVTFPTSCVLVCAFSDSNVCLSYRKMLMVLIWYFL